MSEWCLDSQSELLRPEALSEKELISRLKQARVPVSEEGASHEDLVELFHLHVTPRPQRAKRKRDNDMQIDEQSADKTTSLKRRPSLPPENQPAVKKCTSVVEISRTTHKKQSGGDDVGRVTNSVNFNREVNRKRPAPTSLLESNSVIHRDENGQNVLGQSVSKKPFSVTPVKWP